MFIFTNLTISFLIAMFSCCFFFKKLVAIFVSKLSIHNHCFSRRLTFQDLIWYSVRGLNQSKPSRRQSSSSSTKGTGSTQFAFLNPYKNTIFPNSFLYNIPHILFRSVTPRAGSFGLVSHIINLL